MNSTISSVWGQTDSVYGPGSHTTGCPCNLCCLPRTFTRDIFKGPTSDFFLQLEMPGTKRESISVKLKGSFLNIVYTTRLGESKTYSCLVGDKYYEQDKLSCTYKDGLLTVIAPLKKVEPEIVPQEPETVIEIK